MFVMVSLLVIEMTRIYYSHVYNFAHSSLFQYEMSLKRWRISNMK